MLGEKKTLHFGSSDIKALLIVAYDMFLNKYPSYSRAGTRCEKDGANKGQGSQDACLDTNAGSFFILTSNFIKPNRNGFVIDVDPGQQVWNQPVSRYIHTKKADKCPVTIANPAPGTISTVLMHTQLYYVGELAASEKSHGSASEQVPVNYTYCLELDGGGNVLGGEWVAASYSPSGDVTYKNGMAWDRPDFIWMSGMPDFSQPVTDSISGKQFDLRPLVALHQKSIGASGGSGTGGGGSSGGTSGGESSGGGNSGGGTTPTQPGGQGGSMDQTECSGLRYANCMPMWPKCKWFPPRAADGKCVSAR